MPVVTNKRAVRPIDLYLRALRQPGALAFFLIATPGRIGIAMTGLGLVWLVHWITGSFAAAGVVVGTFAIAEAIVGPQLARFVDRYGQSRLLPLYAIAHGSAMALTVTFSAMRTSTLLIAAASALAGATIPQFGALTAARWVGLLSGKPLLTTAFAIESMSNGLAFLCGPALVGLLSALVYPAAGSIFAGLLVVSSAGLLATQKKTAPAPAARSSDSRASLVNVGFAVLVALNICIGAFFGAMQVSVTAFAIEHDDAALAGPLYSVLSCASLLAGLLYGRRPRNSPLARQLALVLTTLCAGTLVLLAMNSTGLLALALLLPGAALAPILILLGTLTEKIVHKSVLTQAFTWQNSASMAGSAASAAIAGHLTDSFDAHRGFALAVAASAVAATLAWLGRKTLSRNANR